MVNLFFILDEKLNKMSDKIKVQDAIDIRAT
jgi:hypothetical protein